MGAAAACLGNKDRQGSRVVEISHFDIQRQLGKGGFGAVHAVEKTTNPEKRKWFAMKTLDKAVIAQNDLFDDVLAELNLLRGLRCPLICNAHYAFQDAASLYICMDIFMGGDLRFYLLTKGPFTQEQVLFYGASMVLALEYLHNEGVLHRDIKPDNILMDEQGHVSLTDLGICFRSKERPLLCTQNSGTAGYMAPELYTSSHGHGVSSEAFSLGVVLFELATGTKPYSGNRLAALQDYAGEESQFWAHADMLQAGEELRNGLEGLCGKGRKDVPLVRMLRSLLHMRPESRLGASGMGELRAHEALAGTDWDGILARTAKTPLTPANQANVRQDEGEVMFVLGQTMPLKNNDLPPEVQARFAGWYYDHNQRDESLSSTGTLASTLSSTLRAANHIGSTAIQATRRSLIAHLPGDPGSPTTGTRRSLIGHLPGDPGASTSPTTGIRRSLNTPTGVSVDQGSPTAFIQKSPQGTANGPLGAPAS